MKFKKAVLLGMTSTILGTNLLPSFTINANEISTQPSEISNIETYATVPSWVWSTVWKLAKYGVNHIQNSFSTKKGSTISTDSTHIWGQSLGEVAFNNKSLNTGSAVGHTTPIKTTWNQSRVKTTVSMNATKRAFTSGSNYIALARISSTGQYYDLGRISSGSSKQNEITGANGNAGTFDFRYVYTDTAIWDLTIWYNDQYWPSGSVTPAPVLLNENQHILIENSENNVQKVIIGDKVFRMPVTSIQSNVKNHAKKLNFQELLDQKTDTASNRELDIIKDYSIGDIIKFSDIISNITYNPERNVTFFQFESVEDEMYGLEFYGDLTSEYFIGDNLELQFKVEKLGEYEQFIFETLNYLQDESFSIDSAPNIQNYIG